MEIGQTVLFDGEAAICVNIGFDYVRLNVFSKNGGSHDVVVNNRNIDIHCKSVGVPQLIRRADHVVPVEVVSYTNIPGVNDLSEYVMPESVVTEQQFHTASDPYGVKRNG